MTAAIPSSPILPNLYTAPNKEIIGDNSNGTNGLYAVGQATNYSLYHKVGTLVNDSFTEDEVALTDDDLYQSSGLYRRWWVKTPRYLNLTANYSKFTVWFYFEKTGTDIEYEVFVNSVLVGVILFTGTLSLGWHEGTVTGNLTLDDTLESQEIKIRVLTWNGSNTTTYRVRDIAIYHVLDQSTFASGTLRTTLYPVPTTAIEKNYGASTFILRGIQQNLVNIFENRVGQIVTGCHYRVIADTSTSTLESVTKFRLNVPKGVTQFNLRVLCLRGAGTTARLGIRGYTGDDIETDYTKIPNPVGWVTKSYNVSPGGSPVITILANNISIYALCAHYVKGSYT